MDGTEMRILTFTSLFPNKVQPLHGLFVFQRARHLARRGHWVQVLAPVPYAPRWAPLARYRAIARVPWREELDELDVYHPRYPFFPRISMPAHGWLMYRGSFRLAERLHEKHRFDCLDAHYVYPDGFAAVCLGRQLGLPVIVSARGTDINLFPSFRLIRPQIRWTLQQAAGVISVSVALKQEMVRLGMPEGKARAIGNGIDLERFEPVARRDARRRLGMSEDAKIVVSIGALIPEKGHQVLISAVAELLPRIPALWLYIVGDGAYRRKLQALAAARGVADRVCLVGARPNEGLKDWYSAADVSCLASAREGWPNVLLESLACGTPVVATRVGGAAEVIVSAELGVLVEQSVSAIAQGLERALAQPWDRDHLVQYARSRTWDVVAREIEEFLLSRIALGQSPQVEVARTDA
jgi:glycosyltransferase involved in cell wall biosynthesis